MWPSWRAVITTNHWILTHYYHQDVIYIGRIVGIPGFLLDDGQELEKEGTRLLTQMKRDMSQEDKNQMHRIEEARITGRDTSNMEDPSKVLAAAGYSFVKKLQSLIGDCMIRRTINSKKPDGSNINDSLPPLIRLAFPVPLPDSEMNLLKGEIDKMKSG